MGSPKERLSARGGSIPPAVTINTLRRRHKHSMSTQYS